MHNNKKTSIKEIVFTISFSGDYTSKNLEDFASLQEIASVFQKKVDYNYTSEVRKNPIFTNTSFGLILQHKEDTNKILNIKNGLFSFHKVKEYENYESLFENLQNYWGIFSKMNNILITKISLRYLNFIEINDESDMKEWLNIEIKHPFNVKLINNFNQIKFIHPKDSSIEANIITTLGKDKQQNGIILDIILNKNINHQNFKNIHDLFENMREIKNDIYEQSITEQTKKLYK
jgi:uncharacterized protein (TIGR04255 family)